MSKINYNKCGRKEAKNKIYQQNTRFRTSKYKKG